MEIREPSSLLVDSKLVALALSWRNGEGNGTPLQYSCLENPMDGGAWWAPVHGVAKSQTQLSNFTFTFSFHGGFIPNFLKESPYCLPQWLDQFTFLPTVQEHYLFSTPSPAFVCRLSDDGHFDQCEVISHCSFNLHFSNNEQC